MASLVPLRLGLRKSLVEVVADEFEQLYEANVGKQLMMFEDQVTRNQYRDDVVFSKAALMLGCGVVRVYGLRCGASNERVDRATRVYPGCRVVQTGDVRVPLPLCRRVWQLRTRDPVPCGLHDNCTVCDRVEARHDQAHRILEREIDSATQAGRRFVAMAVYIQAPHTARSFDAFARREIHVANCKELTLVHACALLIDIDQGIVWLVESQRVLPFVQARLEEFALDVLGMRVRIHRLTTQHEFTPRGEFRYQWCVLYSQAMCLGLVDALLLADPIQPLQRAERLYLIGVWRLMYRFMKRRTQQTRAANQDGVDLVSRLSSLLADAELE